MSSANPRSATPRPAAALPPYGGRPQQVGSWPWMMSAAVGLAVVLTAVNLNGVLRGYSWLPSVIFAVGAVVAGTAAARVLRIPTALVPLAGTLGLSMALTVRFFPADSLLGFIPNRSTLDAVPQLLRQANDIVLTQVAPVQPLDGMVFVTCLSLGLVALLVDTLASALRMPATSGLGLLAVLVVPAVVKPASIGPWGFAAAIIGFLVLLGTAHWFFGRGAEEPAAALAASRLNPALAIGAAGVAAALIVPLAIPGFSSGLFPEGSRISLGTASGLNPMITLGNDLRNPGSVGRMTYATTSDDPVYLRAVTLENFEGDRWEPNLRPDLRRTGVRQMSRTTMETLESIGEISTTIIDTGEFVSPWLPTPYAPLAVTGLDGSWSFDPLTLTILGERGTTTADQVYQVRSVVPDLTRESLAAANEAPSETLDPRFLELPEGMPELIRERADEITADTNNRYHKAMAIQEYLRSDDFVYSETAPVTGGYDGNSMDVVGRFLEAKSGYCVHYSAAMAVMARAEGIPSRIAVGYAPGTSTGRTTPAPSNVLGVAELQQFTVDSDDAHAWPELYFEELGWVPFEPTPSRGVVPDYAMEETGPGAEDQPAEELTPEEAAEAEAEGGAEPAAAEEEPVRGGSVPAGNDRADAAAAGALLLAVLGVSAAPRLLRQYILRRRTRALNGGRLDPGEVASLAWREAKDAATDYGTPAYSSETPRGFGIRLSREKLLDAESAAALRRLVTAYEQAAYGRPGNAGAGTPAAASSLPGGTLTVQRTQKRSAAEPGQIAAELGQHASADLATVRSALAERSSLRQRLRADWFPASLWPQG